MGHLAGIQPARRLQERTFTSHSLPGSGWWHWQSKELQDFLQIFPGQPLIRLVAQEVGGVEGRQHRDTLKFQEFPPHAGDRSARLAKRLQGRLPKGTDDFRLDDVDLAAQVGHAGDHFSRQRRPVARRQP